jgi:hypothetical protein
LNGKAYYFEHCPFVWFFLYPTFQKFNPFSPSGVNVPVRLGPFREIATITGHSKKCVWFSVAFGGPTIQITAGLPATLA